MRVFPIIGTHTSGKSTIGSRLKEVGYLFLPEIAEKLTKEGHTAGIKSSGYFQSKVMEEEFKRDDNYLGSTDPVFPETWHIGNIAHAMEKSKEVADIYMKKFKERLNNYEVHAIFLDVPLEEIPKRTKYYLNESPEDVISFYKKVYDNQNFVLESLGIPFTIVDSSRSIEAVTSDVISKLRKMV
ncbi:MAG: AAA family ATPase [Candidatus Aenigmatarchaeota archaeon]